MAGAAARDIAAAPPAVPATSASASASESARPSEADDDLDTSDTLSMLRHLINEYQGEAKRCSAAGDDANASKFARLTATLMPILARVERQGSEGDNIIIPRSQLEKRTAALRATLKKLTTDMPRCVDCDRRIRVAWADETRD
jgi:cysteinyl-tRNA synthetase